MPIEIIDTIQPKNGLNFPVAHSEDITYDGTISVKDKIDNLPIQVVETKLASINHNLDEYPMVQLRYLDYGAGVGGAGETPAGGTNSEYNDSKFRVVYDDLNNLTIYTVTELALTTPVVTPQGGNKYIITDSTSNTSILIRLI